MLRRVEWGPGGGSGGGGGGRVKGALRWDVDVRPPKAEGGVGDGGAGSFDVDIGSYHVAVPRLELKVRRCRVTPYTPLIHP